MTMIPREPWNRVRRVWTGSIQRRLTLGISVLLAAVMSVFVFDLVNRQDDFLHRQNRDEARALAQTLAANSVSWVLASDLAGLQEVIRTVAHYPDLRYAMVLSKDGRVLAHTDASLVGRYADDAISRSLAAAPRTAQVLVSTASLIDIAAPIQENGTHVGWARVSLSYESSRASLEAVARNGLVYAIIAIVLGVLLSALMVRGLTRDLARLVRAARRIGAGERGVQSGPAREDELGELSGAFDAMASDLDGATRELRDSEEKYRQVSASAQDGVILIDGHGTVAEWNAAAEKIFGYPATEVLGRSLHELLAPDRYRAGWQKGMLQFRESGSGPVVGKTLELAALRRDGSEFPIELSISAVQIRGRWHAIGIVRDITERRRIEDALRHREASLKEAQRLANLGNWELDLATNGLTWTDEIYRIFEIDPAKFGASYEAFLDAIHPDDRALVDKTYTESVRNRTRYDIEHRLQMKDGRIKYVNERCETTYDEAGRPLRSIGTVQDITVRKEAEQALRERDAYIARLIVKSPLAMLVSSDREQRVDFVNEKFTELFGYTLEDMPDVAHWWPLAYPDEAYREEIKAEWTRKVAQAMESQGEIDPMEATVRCKDGSHRYIEFRLSSVGARNLITFVDLTERKRAEERQRAAALYARSLIEASLDPLVTISPEGTVTDVNRMTEEATGMARAELIGSDFADYFTEPDQARAGYRRVLAQGYVRDYPLTIRHRDGRTTDVLYNATVYRNEAGELQGVFAAARDITERKQAEAVRTQLVAIVESSNDAIIGKDLDGIITSWNPGAEKVYGYRADEIVGQPIAILAPEGRKKEVADLLAAVARGDTVANFETERLRKDGMRIDVSLALSPIMDASGRIAGVSTIARDVTEKKQAERALHKVNRALKALSHGNTALIHATDEIQLLNEMCRVIVEIAGYRMAWVGYPEHDEGKNVRLVAQSGYAPDFTAQADITWADTERGRGALGIALRTGQIQVVQDVMTDERFEPWRTNAVRLGYGSVLVAPLVSGSEAIGALSINAEGAHAFDEAEIDLLSELAADMAFGIVTLRMRAAHEHSAQRVQRGMEETIGAIAATVEMRDPYTAGHQRRVAELAVAIGRELCLSEERVHGLHLAGVVHDLGKVHIPAEILSKPGRLNRIELELIKTHPQAGYEILKGIDFPWPIAQVVLQHHERFDGSGYPRGLKGDEILLEAKILTVADVVEAMASHRPYRPSLGLDAALKEIEASAGKYYDPDVARACVTLFREKGFVLTEAAAAA